MLKWLPGSWNCHVVYVFLYIVTKLKMSMTIIISGHTCHEGLWAKHVRNPTSPWEHVEPLVHGIDHFNNQLPWHLGKQKSTPYGSNPFFDCSDMSLNFWYILMTFSSIPIAARLACRGSNCPSISKRVSLYPP